MPTITISQTTMDLIEEAKTPGLDFRPTGARRTDGRWDVPVHDDLHERLLDLRIPGEDFDQVIDRVARAHLGRKPN